MVISIILLSLGFLSMSLFIFEKVKRYSFKATMIKTVTSLLFIALGLYGVLAKTLSLMGFCVVFGLICGLLGDVFLDLKYDFIESENYFTNAGFIVFALGHIFYMIGIYSEYYIPGNPLYIIIPLVLGVGIGLANVFLGKFMKLDYKNKKPLVFVYGAILFSMVLSAGSLWMLHGFNNATLLMIFIGGILFAVSDLILSGTYFGIGKERPVDIILNSITYYSAQFIIAFSLFFVVAA